MARDKVYMTNDDESGSDLSSQSTVPSIKSKPAPADIDKKTNSVREQFQDLAKRAYHSFTGSSPRKKVHAIIEQDFPVNVQKSEERRASAPPVLVGISEDTENRLFSYYWDVVKGGKDFLPSQTLSLTGAPDKAAFTERRGNACLTSVLEGSLPRPIDQQRFICLCMSKSNITHLDLSELDVENVSDDFKHVEKRLNDFLGHVLDYNLNITHITLPATLELSQKVEDRLIINKALSVAFYYNDLLTQGKTPAKISSNEMMKFIHNTVEAAMHSSAFEDNKLTGLKVKEDDQHGQATFKQAVASYEKTMLTPMKEMLERTKMEPIEKSAESTLTSH